MRISITEAAKQGYKSRATLNRDVRSGKLSHTIERGTKMVDVADLVRLYGEPGAAPVRISAEEALVDQAREQWEAEKLRLEAELREAKAKIEDQADAQAKERERLMDMVENANKLLADLRADKERDAQVMQELTEALNRPLLARLFGRK